MLDPGLRRDDVRKAADSSTVIPAQAGIQRLCFNDVHQVTAGLPHTLHNQILLRT
jgi:hypothetical protein